MAAHGQSVYSQHGGTRSAAHLCGAEFHSDPVDHDDFDQSANPGSHADISVFLQTFRNGLLGGPWKEQIDVSLIEFVTLPGFSGILVFYGPRYIGCCHVDNENRISVSDLNEQFSALVKTMVGVVSR